MFFLGFVFLTAFSLTTKVISVLADLPYSQLEGMNQKELTNYHKPRKLKKERKKNQTTMNSKKKPTNK